MSKRKRNYLFMQRGNRGERFYFEEQDVTKVLFQEIKKPTLEQRWTNFCDKIIKKLQAKKDQLDREILELEQQLAELEEDE